MFLSWCKSCGAAAAIGNLDGICNECVDRESLGVSTYHDLLSDVLKRRSEDSMTALWDETIVSQSKPNKRAAILDTAKGYVTKDRQATHGEPEDSFGMIARLWSAYLGQEIKSHDVCSMMALLKVARAKGNPANDDNWVDMAGYAACGAEVAK